jgi:hypothetical protein
MTERNVRFGFAVLLTALFIPPLADGLTAAEGVTLVGLLTGHVLAVVLRRGYAGTRDGEESATEPHTLSNTVIFTVLKNRRRREALQYLRHAEGPVSLGDLAEYIAAKENDVETDQLTSAQRKRVYTTLYQCHLPMMDDADVVEYDQNRGSVELLDAASELFEHIDNLET